MTRIAKNYVGIPVATIVYGLWETLCRDKLGVVGSRRHFNEVLRLEEVNIHYHQYDSNMVCFYINGAAHHLLYFVDELPKLKEQWCQPNDWLAALHYMVEDKP